MSNFACCVERRSRGSCTSAKTSTNCVWPELKPTASRSARNLPGSPVRSVTSISALERGHSTTHAGLKMKSSPSGRPLSSS